MDVLFRCFVLGLIIGIPVWVLLQYARPRVGFVGLPVFGGSGPSTTEIKPVVLNGHFVADMAKLPS